MNFKIVEQIVNYIDNYNTIVDDECLINITSMSPGYVRNEFKKVVGISLNKYRIRRQLTKIIEQAKVSGCKISECDLEPWGTVNSFYKAFKKEYKVSPSEFLKQYDESKLQEKENISIKISQYGHEEKIIDSLFGKYGGNKDTLVFLLSLEPYQFSIIDKIATLSFDVCYERLINSKYGEHQGQIFFSGEG